MNRYLEFLLVLLSQFAGGPRRAENNLMRFGLAALLWGALLVVAWSRQRQNDLPREKLLVWGFGLGLGRELFMFAFVSLQLLEIVERKSVCFVSVPLERALAMAAVVTVAGSFLRYILDDDRVSRRYLYVGLGATGICYLATAVWWAVYHRANPSTCFGQTWCDWLFRLTASALLIIAIVLLAGKRGWLRNIVLVALASSLLDELLMVCNLASDEAYNSIFCPLSNTLHFWTIPLLGYVYIREQSVERKRAEEELIALNAIATTISQSLDLDHMLNAILPKVLEVMDVDAGWIQLLDEDERTLSLAAQRGFSPEIAKGIQTTKLDGDLTGQVAQSGQPIVVERIQGNAGFGIWTDQQEEEYAFVGVPIESKDKVVGVLSVFVRAPSKPTSQAVQLLTSIGHQIGIAVENARLVEEASSVEILQELNRLRSELIANVSHEVRTPLGLIKLSCTSLLAEDLEFDRDTMRQFLCGIEEETVRLERIVDNLLDISRIESGRLHLDKRPTDLAQLAVEVIENVEIQSPQHQMVHDFVTPLVATVDAKRIEQVLRNLLSNAIKYSPEGGIISVQGYEDKGRIVIQVGDQGIGIAPEELGLVFERFYRVQSEAIQNVSGVGLGLAICQNIIEAHGGYIWVESDLGMGSTFYFAVPAGTGLVTSPDDSFGMPIHTSRPSQIPV